MYFDTSLDDTSFMTNNISEPDRCTCCPFGYHIDLDFVEYTSRATSPTCMSENNFSNNRSINLNRSNVLEKSGNSDAAKQHRQMTTEEYYKTLLANECKEGKMMDDDADPPPVLMSDSFESLMIDFNETLARSSQMSNYKNLDQSSDSRQNGSLDYGGKSGFLRENDPNGSVSVGSSSGSKLKFTNHTAMNSNDGGPYWAKFPQNIENRGKLSLDFLDNNIMKTTSNNDDHYAKISSRKIHLKSPQISPKLAILPVNEENIRLINQQAQAVERLNHLEAEIKNNQSLLKRSTSTMKNSNSNSLGHLDNQLLQEKLNNYVESLKTPANFHEKSTNDVEYANLKIENGFNKPPINSGTYRTALGRAMSSLGNRTDEPNSVSSSQSVPNTPEPPRRNKSIERMRQMSTTSSNFNAANASTPAPPKVPYRQPSPNLFGDFHSLRRVNKDGYSNLNKPNQQYHSALSSNYTSDSEYSQNTTNNNYSNNKYANLRRSRILLGQQNNAGTVAPSLTQNGGYSIPSVLKHQAEPIKIGHRELNGESCTRGEYAQVGSWSTRKSEPIQSFTNGKPSFCNPATATLDESVKCRKCEKEANRYFRSISTYTGPFPEAKPCRECENLRRKLQISEFRPVTFDVSTNIDECQCKLCISHSEKSWISVNIGCDGSEWRKNELIQANLPTLPETCIKCVENSKKMCVSFGINTTEKELNSAATSTECVEVATRKTNTESPELYSSATNTILVTKKDSTTSMDPKILRRLGFAYEKASSTDTPLSYSVGFNTDLSIDTTTSATSDNHRPMCVTIETQTELGKIDTATGLDREDQEFFARNASCGTMESVLHKNMFTMTEKQQNCMIDRSIECSPKCKDNFTIMENESLVSTSVTMALKGEVSESSVSATIFLPCEEEVVKSENCLQPEELDTTSVVLHELKEALKKMNEQNSEVLLQDQESHKVEEAEIGDKKLNLQQSEPDSNNVASSTESFLYRAEPNLENATPSPEKISEKTDSVKEGRNESDEESDDEDDQSFYTESSENENEPNLSTLENNIDEKVGKSSRQESSMLANRSGKFDFSKPRPTRAFALSKAAATKKLLTSKSSEYKYSKSPGSQKKFERTAHQSKSVRVSSLNKGDHLALITDGKCSKNVNNVEKPKVNNILNENSTGLNDVVPIKKPLYEKRQNNATKSVAFSPIKRREKLPQSNEVVNGKSNDATTTLKQRQIFRKSLLIEEELAEVADTLGPLPSELWNTSSPSTQRRTLQCYENLAFSSEKNLDNDGKAPKTNNSTENNNNYRSENSSFSSASSSDDDDGGGTGNVSDDEGTYSTTTMKSVTRKIDKSTPLCNGDEMAISEALRQACEVADSYLKDPDIFPADVKPECALQFLQHDWLKAAGRKSSDPKYVESFLDLLEAHSQTLLHKVVNMCDQNDNTALHYAVSHCNFDIASLLLDSKVCNLNKPNRAGYTPVMLAALCQIQNQTDALVIQRLFQLGNVNIKASQHGQTALMLAASHGKLETSRMLLETGADLNIQDEDGSTALMCAAEHGHLEIVRMLLDNAEVDASLCDDDGSTALSIAVENGHKDIGVLIYAHLNYGSTSGGTGSAIRSQSMPVWC